MIFPKPALTFYEFTHGGRKKMKKSIEPITLTDLFARKISKCHMKETSCQYLVDNKPHAYCDCFNGDCIKNKNEEKTSKAI